MSTGFPNHVRQLIRQRSNDMCERCGQKYGTEVHHRRPRGMGGTKQADTNVASNALHLCGLCHKIVEQSRDQAINNGWLVKQNHNPIDIPVLYRGAWMYLDDDGNMQPVEDVI